MQYITVQKNILDWYTHHKRTFPWRTTTNPYAIHISEVMLQQTQADRVVPYFLQWMKDFPDYETLALASKKDVLTHRSWLWFNSRALRLQQCAKIVVSEYKWKLPQKRELLLQLPWIWPYTSAAILAFARNKEVPVIDTNIRRVLLFLFKLPETISLSDLELFASKIVPTWKSRDWHNALMDFWALELTARKTKIKPLNKQSSFEGSDRQVRWWIMKQLVRQWSLSLPTIIEEFPRKDALKIIDDLKKEKLITYKKWLFFIAE